MLFTTSCASHSGTVPKAAAKEDPFDIQLQHGWQVSEHQLSQTVVTLAPTTYPFITNVAGTWETTGARKWTSGFFPGSLWFLYQQTANPLWKTKAQEWQAGIESQKTNTSTHDVGFMIFTSFGNSYRLSGNDADRQVILSAAHALATRFSPTVGCLKSWESDVSDFKVIIDNMMNLELLFWAATHGGDHTWYDMAVSHALKTIENHVRADGSTYHLVNYNPTTGAVQSRGTVQGFADESTWSRGQAWALYGFTLTYRETGDTRFLQAARMTADYFISHLPSDSVPYWDFQAPGIPHEPRDSSAAAIAASGLLELSELERDAGRQHTYLNSARNILTALASSEYLAEGTTNHAILLHGTPNKPGGRFDLGLIYGDYYFLEALLRYRWIVPTSPALAIATVTASPDEGTAPENTLGHDLRTSWSAAGDGQWIQYDLGTVETVRKVAIAWDKGNERSTSFEIHLSRDGVHWTTVFHGLSSGLTALPETYDFPDSAARYVRIVGHGNVLNAGNSPTEVMIF
ncbi:MAG TPA: discoidin domain-containing protein [Candidatus Binatia bacterium]|nr:discoidin domain-containing protein [Candidatus Binatia bacterium]